MIPLPQRPEQHGTGDVAAAAFDLALSRGWSGNRSKSDYGWDFIVAISRAGRMGFHFFAQVKGTENLTILGDGDRIGHSVKTSTVGWLLSQPMPAMLAICDVSGTAHPVYWVWIHDAVEEVERRNARWAQQQSVTLHVPVANRLAPETHDRIEADVVRHHEAIAVGLQAMRVLAPTSVLPTVRDTGLAPVDNDLRITVFSALERGRLAQMVSTDEGPQIQAYSPTDQTVLHGLDEVKTLLGAHQNSAAQERLVTLATEIEHAVPPLRARYANAHGILAIQDDNRTAAVESFRQAAALEPDDVKYATNLLTAEYNAAWDAGSVRRPLPEDWVRRLDAVLARSPAYVQAIRLRGHHLSDTRGADEAEQYLRGSELWQNDRESALLILAEAYRREYNFSHALDLVEEAEALSTAQDPHLDALKGQLLYGIAVRATGPESLMVRGFGPPSLDLPMLRRAAEAYGAACAEFAKRGHPRIGEPAVRGYAAVKFLLGQAADVESVCLSYLRAHPDAVEIHGVMAMALAHEQDLGAASTHARLVLADRSADSQTYINALVALLCAEDYRGVLHAVTQRESTGFSDKAEEWALRDFAAIAYASLGEGELARRQIQLLRDSDVRVSRVVVAETAVMKAEGASSAAVVEHLRVELAKDLSDPTILTMLVHELLPPMDATATEILSLVERLRALRQLAPDEMVILGRCYLVLERPREAAFVFEHARYRYPTDHRLMFEHAHALTRLGDADAAYDAMRGYLEFAKGDQLVYRNMGYLARESGRLDEAIDMFEQALRRRPDESEQAELHCLLWELRRRRGDSPKQLLRHIVTYGKLVTRTAEAEARYLLLWLLTPGRPEVADAEERAWMSEFQDRLRAFGDAHPRFAGLQSIRIPDGLSVEQQRAFLLSEIGARSLPAYLVRSQIELLLRGGVYPLTTRNRFLRGDGSVFQYWDLCLASDEYSHSLHIHEAPRIVASEVEHVPLGRSVCLDLTALLTLALLDLLDGAEELFAETILARGTVLAIRKEFRGIEEPHELAQRLQEWVRSHRRVIRVQAADGVADRVEWSSYGRHGPLWVPSGRTLPNLVPDGVGETVMLAAQLGRPLYSDETTIRAWADEDHAVQSFSTLALLAALRRAGRLTISNEARCLALLITRNYRYVTFTDEHLHSALMSIIGAAAMGDLDTDPVLGPLLREFGNTQRPTGDLAEIAVAWWQRMLQTTDIDESTIRPIVRRIAFALAQRCSSPDAGLATVWASWIQTAYRRGGGSASSRVWNVIAKCTEDLVAGTERRHQRLLLVALPDTLYDMPWSTGGAIDEERDKAIIGLSGGLPRAVMDRLFYRAAGGQRR